MIETTGRFAAPDGTMLFERSWRDDHTEPTCTVAILHGGAEHSGRYAHTAQRFTAAGHEVVAFDQRSHGRSERLRGVPFQIASFDDLLDDTEQWIAARHRLHVDGLITSGAALRVIAPSALRRARLLAESNPDAIVLPLPRDGFDASTRDPAMRAAILDDPVHADVTGVPAAFMAEVARITSEVAGELDNVNVPLLAMHGTADTTADPAASVELVQRAASTDKTLKLIPDACRALLRDLDRAETESEVLDWIAVRWGVAAQVAADIDDARP